MSELKRPSIGVCCIVRRNGKVLLHKRKGSHAPGCWAFPGGHLEMFEEFAVTACRELGEEAGMDLRVSAPQFWTISNTKYYDEGKHYVVIYMICDWISGEAYVVEPEKCECWEWHSWDKLPEPLMQGLIDLRGRGLNPMEA